MANMTVSDIDVGSVCIGGDPKFRDELLTFAATDTFVKGTILARQKVVLAITPSAVTGTGNGTVTAASVVGGSVIPKIGNYVLRNTAAVANGGVWRLEDPDGMIVASDLRMTVGASSATIFEAGGLIFTINDGGTDFALGDTFTLPVVTNSDKLVPFNPAGAGGAQFPTHILTYEVSRTGAGDVKVRALVKGEVDKNRLIIDVDGSNANVTTTVIQQLRELGIIVTDVQSLSGYDQHD